MTDHTTKIGMECTKEGDFSKWYQQVLTRSDMIEYYDVSGCYILRPWAYGIWEQVQTWLDREIKEIGAENAYFPLLIPKKVLEKETDHVEGFAPEVAWVTKAGDSDLEEHLAIRPTSETVMYSSFAKWIRSHRDLPLKVNQWCNVLRWEFSNCQPFIRSREFLWQEGHTAHATKAEADAEVATVLDLYRQVYEDLMAVPVIQGVKSDKEKFAGGLYTTTVEAYIPTTGRGVQAATSHCLGQNFAHMFDIQFEDPTAAAAQSNTSASEKMLHVWQNSWGFSTRSLGVMVMVHGDDRGLVLPPRIATLQVVIIPCGINTRTSDEDKQAVQEWCVEVRKALVRAGIRAKVDDRSHHSAGYKFNHWELKGVPVRLEIGPKDVKLQQAVAVRRDTGIKTVLHVAGREAREETDGQDSATASKTLLVQQVQALLDAMHADMFERAKTVRDDRLSFIKDGEWSQVGVALDKRHWVMMPWCEQTACEINIKERTAKKATTAGDGSAVAAVAGAKSLCIPFDQPQQDDRRIVQGETKCLACGSDAKRWALFGRSY
ncbi:hypothetical protein BGZ73_008021 [Actinomortierella ambigua]|nr:hypothetical protein BGZ73_008021 [Actinomortierella ambigua]